MESRTTSRKAYTGVKGAALHSFLPTIDEAGEEDDGDDVMVCDNGGAMAMQVTLDLPEPTAGDIEPEPKNRQQAMKSTEWSAWGKAEETEMRGMVKKSVYEQVVRPKDKLVDGTKMLYKRKVGEDGTVEKYKCRLVAQGGRGTLHGKVLTHTSGRVDSDAFSDGSG